MILDEPAGRRQVGKYVGGLGTLEKGISEWEGGEARAHRSPQLFSALLQTFQTLRDQTVLNRSYNVVSYTHSSSLQFPVILPRSPKAPSTPADALPPSSLFFSPPSSSQTQNLPSRQRFLPTIRMRRLPLGRSVPRINSLSSSEGSGLVRGSVVGQHRWEATTLAQGSERREGEGSWWTVVGSW